MITDIILIITNFIIQTINTLGYSGVVLLMAIESTVAPVPSEIIMPFAGSLVGVNHFTLFGLAIAGAVGSVIGSLVSYAVAYYGGRPLIIRFGRYFFMSEQDLELTEKFFARFGKLSTFMGRLIPVVRSIISLPAGLGKVPIGPFIFYTFTGSFIFSYSLAWLGLKLGENWHILEIYFRKFDIAIVLIILSLVGFWIYRHFKHRS
jgi:membrane protein DedA with SNARE-associated domain